MTTFTSEASSYNCSLCELIGIYADSELFQKVASLDVFIWYQREATFLSVFLVTYRRVHSPLLSHDTA